MTSFLPPLLKNKKIILGVSGSVSIYKSLEVLRGLQKLGASVRVVMSNAAQNFIQPLLFEALSHHQVLHTNNQSWGENPCNHIELATFGDVFLITPASANTINKLASGIADNPLLETFLAYKGIRLIAPSANTKMLENKITQDSLKKLESLGICIIPPLCKELACKAIGKGALAEPLEIIFRVLKECFKQDFWLDKEVCISGGGSIEALDSVRYLSNHSSGKMAQFLSIASYLLGAKTTYIGSKFPLTLPKEITSIQVQNTKDYLNALSSWQKIAKNRFLIMAAAISDYIPKHTHSHKLKKEDLGETWELELIKNQDILSTIKKENQITIGFKLESKEGVESAKNALKNKNLNAICLNMISENSSPFNADTNNITFISNKICENLGEGHKLDLAFQILNKAKGL
ncbi:bifunctional phosphopantothenoylcysteine decarboxylase/phosphopantothenate--cysteine ligase CoaBC [Helicobacter burdigaliensis]|uniref:bifunctional phosphopantothenoylcysteine decarboxylase/phosphopantothenate--cysteine ligase CoaBC n=1 Tax=Helicobacter burdigaliensis TaxID=2315334 RepID=UPI000EF68D1F|nr:bifunctional phosphopantothenoylcysteine decarboxylase/phosphopantothenate--cysteine ligase CoaBC [Helicobacter burdigaliensis]